jgi:GNAT superfamily N-acetyltransferase
MGSMGEPNGHHEPVLPHRNSEDVYLDIATQAELVAQQHINSIEWRGALDHETYLRREEHLANQEQTRDGALMGWVLVYKPHGTSDRKVLCGCETYRKKALVSHNGQVEDTVVYGVGSVFCPPEHRGKGYAARMMNDLGKRLRSWQMDGFKKPRFSILFSDIGKQFYARSGWQPFPSSHVSLPVPAVESAPRNLPSVRLLKADDISDLCMMDEKLIRRRLAKSNGSAVALVPNSATVRWHHAREEFVAKELFNRNPIIKGAVAGEVGSRVWCYWTRVWTNPQEDAGNTLHILRLVVEDETFSDFTAASEDAVSRVKDSATARAIAAVFGAAQAQAAQWGMHGVQIWNPTSTTLAAARMLNENAAVENREKESIAALNWYGEGSWEDVDWICNEKYGVSNLLVISLV